MENNENKTYSKVRKFAKIALIISAGFIIYNLISFDDFQSIDTKEMSPELEKKVENYLIENLTKMNFKSGLLHISNYSYSDYDGLGFFESRDLDDNKSTELRDENLIVSVENVNKYNGYYMKTNKRYTIKIKNPIEFDVEKGAYLIENHTLKDKMDYFISDYIKKLDKKHWIYEKNENNKW